MLDAAVPLVQHLARSLGYTEEVPRDHSFFHILFPRTIVLMTKYAYFS